MRYMKEAAAPAAAEGGKYDGQRREVHPPAPARGVALVAEPVQPALHARSGLPLPRRPVRPPRRAQGRRRHRLARLLDGLGAARRVPRVLLHRGAGRRVHRRAEAAGGRRRAAHRAPGLRLSHPRPLRRRSRPLAAGQRHRRGALPVDPPGPRGMAALRAHRAGLQRAQRRRAGLPGADRRPGAPRVAGRSGAQAGLPAGGDPRKPARLPAGPPHCAARQRRAGACRGAAHHPRGFAADAVRQPGDGRGAACAAQGARPAAQPQPAAGAAGAGELLVKNYW
ncbi:hypothetical protein OF001_U40100 [Pseudomonas sp. OF001]|nr:hypothetical protein OF001_U40100 [Pseudomonas sp. OF001]